MADDDPKLPKPPSSNSIPTPPPSVRMLIEERSRESAHLAGRLRRLVRRLLPSEAQRLFALTLAVGVVCGFVAVAFHLAIRASEAMLIERAFAAPGRLASVLIVVVPTVGGLIAGAMLTWVVPGARGSGIPQVKEAFACEGGRVKLRDALGKFFVGAFQIGSGASLGREGPTVQICAGATSFMARLARLSPKGARRLMPVGVAAGIAAAFNAPIAAVTFTIEEIVGKLDQSVLSGVVVAAALAAVIERGVLGVHPVIEVTRPYGLDHASSLLFFALLGIAAAVVSVVFTDGLLGLRAAFKRLSSVPKWTHPAFGGLVTGLLAIGVLHGLGERGVTGAGYETLGLALEGKLALRVLVVLCAVKVVATVFSYSSGGAGGIFAPSLFIGAMLGGVVGYADVAAFGHESHTLGAFALVGMGAVFAGVVRAPITSVLIIFEMTGDYGLVLPLMIANMTAYVLARRWRKASIYEALLEQDGIVLPDDDHPAHGHDIAGSTTVADVMVRDVVTIPTRTPAVDALKLVENHRHTFYPVVRANGTAVGVVRLAVLRAAVGGSSTLTVDELAQVALSVEAHDALTDAASRMVGSSTKVLLVEGPDDSLVGILAKVDIVRALSVAKGRGAPEAAGQRA
jgi:CIC family chloride channel protein